MLDIQSEQNRRLGEISGDEGESEYKRKEAWKEKSKKEKQQRETLTIMEVNPNNITIPRANHPIVLS